MKRKDLPPPSPPLPPPLPSESRRGAVAKPSQRSARREMLSEVGLVRIGVVFWLALASLSTMLISLTPVVREWMHSGDPLTTSWDRWIYLLLFLAMLQSAYVIYLIQLPTGFSLRMCAIISLATASLYCLGLAFFLFAPIESGGVVWLDLIDAHRRGIPANWCLFMLCLYLPLTFYQGKVAADWRREEKLWRARVE